MSITHAHAIPPDDSAFPARDEGSLSTGPPRMTPLREQQLVEQHREGDSEALSELLQSYQRRVYSICYRMVRNHDEAADLAQDTLVKLIEGLEKYDGRAKVSTWVYRITLNCCITHLRRKKVRNHGSLDAMANREGRGGESDDRPISAGQPEQRRELSAEQRIQQDELRARLHKAMVGLDPEMRAILVLRDMQELEYEQLADVLDVPIGTVKSRLFRAREALREAMEQLAPKVGADVRE